MFFRHSPCRANTGIFREYTQGGAGVLPGRGVQAMPAGPMRDEAAAEAGVLYWLR